MAGNAASASSPTGDTTRRRSGSSSASVEKRYSGGGASAGGSIHWLQQQLSKETDNDFLHQPTKAVIPIAGLGTRMFPISGIVPKAFLPIIDPLPSGTDTDTSPPLVRPFLHTLLRYVLDKSTGITQACIIISEDQREVIERYFDMNTSTSSKPSIWTPYESKGGHFASTVREIRDIGTRLTLAVQEKPRGFGHAVLCAEDFIGSDEWFVLLLGDHLYTTPAGDASCLTTLLTTFRTTFPRTQMTSVGVITSKEAQVSGVLRASAYDPVTRVCNIDEMAEKPSASVAERLFLATDDFGLLPGSVLCNFGMDVLPKDVFAELRGQRQTVSGEVELRQAQADLLIKGGMLGVLMRGRHLDTGIPESYMHALNTLSHGDGSESPWTGEEVRRLTAVAGKDAWGDGAGRGKAPGRLDVMGGVADYSGATVFQMPTAGLSTLAAVVPRSDAGGVVRVQTTDETVHPPTTECWETTISALISTHTSSPFSLPSSAPAWCRYVLGFLLVLHDDVSVTWTMDTCAAGFTGVLTSTVPRSAGVSSSASVEVAFARAFCRFATLSISPYKLAHLCQRVEHKVSHAPCGIMDQIAVSFGQPGMLLPIACRPDGAVVGKTQPLPMDMAVWGIVTKDKHSVAGQGYTRARCAAFMGLGLIQDATGKQDISCLCDLTPSELYTLHASKGLLPDKMTGAMWGDRPHLDQQTRPIPEEDYAVHACTLHPVEEQNRGALFSVLIASKKGREAGELMMQSHASYTRIGLGNHVADKIVDAVRANAKAEGVLYGARISGGGEGGTVVVLGERGTAGDEAVQAIAASVGGIVLRAV